MAGESVDKVKREPTTRAQRLAMLEFLRIPDNFAIMTGQATKNKTVKCGQKITRAQGHQMLAEHVNAILHSPLYDSNAGGSNDGNHDDDGTSLAGASNDPDNPNDPENDEYWVANDIEDPGQAMDAPKTPLIEAHGAKATSRGATPVIAGQFPVSEKRLTPRKDFAAVYMDAQSQMAQFECEKFEYMKANDQTI
ncbi:hypothetical protein DYB28_009714 [Aphanomyces astaci]|uniref:Uncharacterized protein n=1 Tax=Aphanomyces astaci TaxID=112090 RepID=A0A9X8EB90_APHAT|nr:hypothetical protein DYB28_009714 [Aphanomyces astaci]